MNKNLKPFIKFKIRTSLLDLADSPFDGKIYMYPPDVSTVDWKFNSYNTWPAIGIKR
jgi:hypothetical protein